MSQISEAEVVIRPPGWVRTMYVVFGGAWCGVVLAAELGLLGAPGPGRVILAAFLVAGTVMIWRTVNLAVIADGQLLVVRNFTRTRQLSCDDIEGFRTGKGRYGPCLSVVMSGQQFVDLDATTLPVPTWLVERRLEEKLAALRAWWEFHHHT